MNISIPLLPLLTVLFVALKLTGYIAWPWLWVLSPIWLPLAIFFAVGVALAVIIALASLIQYWVKR